jgi:signal transduction histidine kinase
MRERLKLVEGDLSIESQPASGTTIVARVPLPADPAASARGSVGV